MAHFKVATQHFIPSEEFLYIFLSDKVKIETNGLEMVTVKVFEFEFSACRVLYVHG